ncbi:hypothetical protein B0H10DRAFT_1942186 [Mycena sp. CBHHK59/15]|nr:hypothetical protein B0H10DRAFT_1942186 [Mycena sp. CBHHK59/15]
MSVHLPAPPTGHSSFFVNPTDMPRTRTHSSMSDAAERRRRDDAAHVAHPSASQAVNTAGRSHICSIASDHQHEMERLTNTTSRSIHRSAVSDHSATLCTATTGQATPPIRKARLTAVATSAMDKQHVATACTKELLNKTIVASRANFPHMATWDKRTRDPKDIPSILLQNDHLPACCLPSTYNLAAYSHAILYHPMLHVKETLGPLDVCNPCMKILLSKKPVNAIANFQYYARDKLPPSPPMKDVFCNATLFNLQLVSRSRATKITHFFSKKKGSHLYGTSAATSQCYNLGNVAIFAQDVATVRSLLPPDISNVHEAMCALFIGHLGLALVSKNCVATIIDFLLHQNDMYLDAGVEFSAENMDNLFSPGETEVTAVPCTRSTNASSDTASPMRYDNLPIPRDEIIMEAVGYIAGCSTPQDYNKMKVSALAWCLDKKKYQSSLSRTSPGVLCCAPHMGPVLTKRAR